MDIGLPKIVLDIVDVLAKIGTVSGVLYAISSGLRNAKLTYAQRQESNLQRAEDQRWRQHNAGLEEARGYFADPTFVSALRLLDWEGWSFEISPGQIARIGSAEVNQALDVRHLTVGALDAFIRDCFDTLFTNFSLLEVGMKSNVINKDDIEPLFGYYAEKLKKRWDTMEPFLTEYGYSLVKPFIDRFVP
jgi:hypothetical protein